MPTLPLVLVCFLCFLTRTVMAESPEGKKGKNLTLDRADIEKVLEIHQNWYLFSIKALLGQLGKELLHLMDSGHRERLKLCLKRVVYSKDLKKTAKCLVKAREQWKKNTAFNDRIKPRDDAPSFVIYRRPQMQNPSNLVSASHYKFPKSKKQRRSRLRIQKLKRAKRNIVRLTLPSDLQDSSNSLKVITTNSAPALVHPLPKTPVHRVTDLFVSLFGKVAVHDLPKKWSTTYENIAKLAKVMDSNEKLPGSRVYNTRIYDLVTDSKGTETKQESLIYVPPFLRSAFDIINSFNGQKNTRILSPRIAPLVPDKSSKRILSPSIFPFYKDDTEQQILPVPKVLESVGLNEKDRERVLEMVMEVSGARNTVDKAMKIGKLFEQLRSSLSNKQNKELDKRGFTFMNSKQMGKLHMKKGLHNTNIREQIDGYKAVPPSKREDLLWENIADLGGIKLRRKRQVIIVSVSKALVLSPYQFAPVYGLTLLGPVILSPNLFSPLILNPSVLSPWVLSPAFPLPFIISPYLLSPYVLSPLAMAPFILTPYVLSPNVINPYVLSPVILSPIVICPDVLSPMVLGGVILSPNVLSPSVFSKGYVMANVLSPSLLS